MKQYNDMEDVLDMVKYAYSAVPLYIELAQQYHLNPKNFYSLPVVSKNTYVTSPVPYISCNYVTDYLNGFLISGRTSGSTGKYTNFCWSPVDERQSLFGLWYYRKKYYGISPKDKMAYFFPIVEEDQDTLEGEKILGLSKAFLYNGKLMQAYNLIQKFQPTWMVLQPSVAWLLCDLIKTHKLETINSVQYIEFTGEYLDEKIRAEIEQFFACKTANQYGLREVNSIAYECPHGNMHIMRNNAYVEIIHKDKKGIGDICLTSLKNNAMPYIRYNTGDKGCLTDKVCPCGNIYPTLEVHKGRDNDWIRINAKEKMHPYMLIQLISEINMLTGNHIIQFQIVQKEYTVFEINMVEDQKCQREQMEQRICELMRRRIKNELTIKFFYFNVLLPDIVTGKIAVFICDMKNENGRNNYGKSRIDKVCV